VAVFISWPGQRHKAGSSTAVRQQVSLLIQKAGMRRGPKPAISGNWKQWTVDELVAIGLLPWRQATGGGIWRRIFILDTDMGARRHGQGGGGHLPHSGNVVKCFVHQQLQSNAQQTNYLCIIFTIFRQAFKS